MPPDLNVAVVVAPPALADSLRRVAGEEPDTLAVRDRDDLRAVRLREYVDRTAQEGCRYPGERGRHGGLDDLIEREDRVELRRRGGLAVLR